MSKVYHICITSIHPTKFHSAITSGFLDTGHFETGVPNDTKMTLNPIRSNDLDVCVISVQATPISPRVVLSPDVFEMQAF